MNLSYLEDQALDLYYSTGRYFWIYSLVARYRRWWLYASSFERWTLYVASFLVGGLAGLVLAAMIRGG